MLRPYGHRSIGGPAAQSLRAGGGVVVSESPRSSACRYQGDRLCSCRQVPAASPITIVRQRQQWPIYEAHDQRRRPVTTDDCLPSKRASAVAPRNYTAIYPQDA